MERSVVLTDEEIFSVGIFHGKAVADVISSIGMSHYEEPIPGHPGPKSIPRYPTWFEWGTGGYGRIGFEL